MLRVISVIASMAAVIVLASGSPRAQMIMSPKQEIAEERAAYARLYVLGYPADEQLAVRRWRGDTGRRGSGPLSGEEVAAVLAQPEPPHYAAFAGNPFQGMGIAVRHKTRAEAEAQAVGLCRREGGTEKLCSTVHVIPGGQCMGVAGYKLRSKDSRPSRGTYVVAPSIDIARTKSIELCHRQSGPAMAGLCKQILSFCADGSEMVRPGATP
jgi:hypothetical protein